MPNERAALPSLLTGLFALTAPALLPACAGQTEAELEHADQPEDALEAECLNRQLDAEASFEATEPDDYTWQANGLGIYERVEGEGTPVEAGADVQVTFAYTGYLLDGCTFDTTELRGPITAPLAGMIPGMREGLIGMRVGGQRRLYIPPELAYGDRGAGQMIGPDEVLVFEVELLEVP